MHDAAWTARMRTEQVRLIYRNAPFTLSANFVLGLIVTGALGGDMPAGVLLG